MRRWALAVLAIPLLGLTACGEPTQQGETTGTYEVITVETDKGPVECVVWDGIKAGGIDCNFNE